MYYEKIVNAETGEEIMRPFTAEETAKIESNLEKIAEEAAAEESKKAQRESALNKLIDLGLTEEEVKAFLG